jgi:hypothetical protein
MDEFNICNLINFLKSKYHNDYWINLRTFGKISVYSFSNGLFEKENIDFRQQTIQFYKYLYHKYMLISVTFTSIIYIILIKIIGFLKKFNTKFYNVFLNILKFFFVLFLLIYLVLFDVIINLNYEIKVPYLIMNELGLKVYNLRKIIDNFDNINKILLKYNNEHGVLFTCKNNFFYYKFFESDNYDVEIFEIVFDNKTNLVHEILINE